MPGGCRRPGCPPRVVPYRATLSFTWGNGSGIVKISGRTENCGVSLRLAGWVAGKSNSAPKEGG
jgi:hypothetical protein